MFAAGPENLKSASHEQPLSARSTPISSSCSFRLVHGCKFEVPMNARLFSLTNPVFQVGFILGVLTSCTPSSSSLRLGALLPADGRDAFEGSWCWASHVTCGVSNSVSKTLIKISKSDTADVVMVMGLKGKLVGSKIEIAPKRDSFGGVWSGEIEKSGPLLFVKLTIYYSNTGITCINAGAAEQRDLCQE